MSASNFETTSVLKFKQRKQHKPNSVPKVVRQDRTCSVFLAFIEEQGLTSWIEMDTVIGRIGGKAIMTFDFTICNFTFGLLFDNKTAAEAASKIRTLKEDSAKYNIRFGDVFPLLLTDNGGEFADISAFMADLNGELETELLL